MGFSDGGNLFGRRAVRALGVSLLAIVVALTCAPNAALAQINAPVPNAPQVDVDIYYTIALPNTAPGAEPGRSAYAALRHAKISGQTLDSATIISPPHTIQELTPYMPGGLMFDAEGRILIAAKRNTVVRFDPRINPTPTNPRAIALPACILTSSELQDPPDVLDLGADTAPDRAWLVTNRDSTGGLTIAPEYESAAPISVRGDDRFISSFSFNTIVENGQPFQRVLYAASIPPIGPDPGGEPTRCIGFVNPRTGSTTRVIGNLPAARTLAGDEFSGHTFAVCGPYIAQINTNLPTPTVVATINLAAIFPGGEFIDLVDATTDGRGRLLAVSADGFLIVLEYKDTHRDPAHVRIDDRSAVIRVFELEPGPPPGFDRTGYPSVYGLAPLSGPGRPRPTECFWDNGEHDGMDGQLSQVNPDQGNPETADDLYLPPGRVYKLDYLTATLATNSLLPNKARLEIYDDCNGKPSARIATFESLDVVPTGEIDGEYQVVTARFALGGIFVSGGQDGRTLWVSVRGIGLGIGLEEWYWLSAGEGVIKGNPGVFRSSSLGYDDWTSIDGFGCGCSDFAFRIFGESCKLVLDGGTPDLTSNPIGVLSQIASESDSAAAADDFVIGPSKGRQKVCYLRAYVYSNCLPVRGRFDLYADSCHSPAGEPLYSGAFTRVTDLNQVVTIDGVELHSYCVESFGLDWLLEPGRNYWVSPVGDTSFALRKKTYAAIGRRCDRGPCLVNFSAARQTGNAVNLPYWATIREGPNRTGPIRDLALLVGVASADPPVNLITMPDCPADIDDSGDVGLQDLFTFLQAWFAGCP